jgi:hypothetical protein
MKIEANTEVDLSIRQEVPKIAGNHQKLEGGKKDVFTSEPSERPRSC